MQLRKLLLTILFLLFPSLCFATTFAQLPTVVIAGTYFQISDANSCTIGSAVTAGGGTAVCNIFWNGSNWIAFSLVPWSGSGGVTPNGAANTPLFNNGSNGFTNGTRSGNTTQVGTISGALTSGNCLKSDANGNLIDTGSACGSGLTVVDVTTTPVAATVGNMYLMDTGSTVLNFPAATGTGKIIGVANRVMSVTPTLNASGTDLFLGGVATVKFSRFVTALYQDAVAGLWVPQAFSVMYPSDVFGDISEGSGTGPSVLIGGPLSLSGNVISNVGRLMTVSTASIDPPVNAIASLAACAVDSEGAHAVANNCNAACTVGGTCTAAGTIHCEVYCNGTAYVETGR